MALGSLLLGELIDRMHADPYVLGGEASWTLATNHRINDQLAAIGGTRSKTWRLYQRPAVRL
jgi:hypothetical protein